MRSEAKTPQEYFNNLPDDRRQAMTKLRNTIKKNLPKGFQEVMGYGMPGWVVPHKLYPAGYHCDPKQPLPFAGLASQKNYISFYHMGLYSDSDLLKWFEMEWPKNSSRKLDMGKCCVRFKNPNDIPYDLIGKLVSRMSPKDWVEYYSKNDPRNRK